MMRFNLNQIWGSSQQQQFEQKKKMCIILNSTVDIGLYQFAWSKRPSVDQTISQNVKLKKKQKPKTKQREKQTIDNYLSTMQKQCAWLYYVDVRFFLLFIVYNFKTYLQLKFFCFSTFLAISPLYLLFYFYQCNSFSFSLSVFTDFDYIFVFPISKFMTKW